jgi:invasion protein IalB
LLPNRLVVHAARYQLRQRFAFPLSLGGFAECVDRLEEFRFDFLGFFIL